MPIVRTYACEACGGFLEVTLSMDQVDAPPPDCPHCAEQTHQEFKPIAIRGTEAGHRDRAVKLAQDIAEKDYGVADYKSDGRVGGRGKVRYKDQKKANPHQWGVAQEALQTAITLGRQTRLQHGGDGLDILQRALKDGTQPDLIEQSKKRAIKVW